LRSRVFPTFGAVELRRITKSAVRSWVRDMADEGLSAARIRQALQVLHASLEVAVDDSLIARNPCSQVKRPTVRKRRQLFLTAVELERLAVAADSQRKGMGGLVHLLGYCGLRWGEAVALRWENVDTARRRIKVKASATEIGGRLEWGPPKTGEVRTVILPRFVIEGARHTRRRERVRIWTLVDNRLQGWYYTLDKIEIPPPTEWDLEPAIVEVDDAGLIGLRGSESKGVCGRPPFRPGSRRLANEPPAGWPFLQQRYRRVRAVTRAVSTLSRTLAPRQQE
jgi:integrase